MQALLDLVADVRPGLFVFGPDRRALRERRYRKALGAVRDRVTCLVWVPNDAAGRP